MWVYSDNDQGQVMIMTPAQISGATYFWEPLQRRRLISFSLQFQLISYMRCKFVGDAFIPGLGEFDTSDRLPSWVLENSGRHWCNAGDSENCTGNRKWMCSVKVSIQCQVITRLREWSVVMLFAAPGMLSLLQASCLLEPLSEVSVVLHLPFHQDRHTAVHAA